MKRVFRYLLCLAMLFLLTGCKSGDSNVITFYYCRDPELYQYFEEDSVIYAESRDLIGHRNDLQYMLGLYLAGPMEEGLVTPFTKSTRLLSVQKTEDTIVIELSDHSKSLSDAEYTLSCACLTLTCTQITSCEEVTVSSGSRTMTLNADNILLYDTLPLQETTGG